MSLLPDTVTLIILSLIVILLSATGLLHENIDTTLYKIHYSLCIHACILQLVHDHRRHYDGCRSSVWNHRLRADNTA